MSNEAPAGALGIKVLVIDDSNTIRRSAEIFLKQGGHQVLLAEDGFDALAKVNDHDPDLIFCDILMPRLDGYQTCAIIKRNARFSSVPVIMLSSKDGLFDRARGRMVGSDQYLTKPFTKDSLLQAVKEHDGLYSPQIENAWRHLMGAGIAFLTARYEGPVTGAKDGG